MRRIGNAKQNSQRNNDNTSLPEQKLWKSLDIQVGSGLPLDFTLCGRRGRMLSRCVSNKSKTRAA